MAEFKFNSDRIDIILGAAVVICGIVISFSEPMLAVLVGAVGGIMLQLRFSFPRKIMVKKESVPDKIIEATKPLFEASKDEQEPAVTEFPKRQRMRRQ